MDRTELYRKYRATVGALLSEKQFNAAYDSKSDADRECFEASFLGHVFLDDPQNKDDLRLAEELAAHFQGIETESAS